MSQRGRQQRARAGGSERRLIARWNSWKARGWLAKRRETVVVAGLVAFVAATNRWVSWAAGYRLLLAHDEGDYRLIALAAPKFPYQRIQEQHAERWPFHYLIGLLAKATGANVDVIYLVCACVLAVALCALLGSVLAEIRLSSAAFLLCMGVFILNAYSLRYYGLAPGELADLLFDAGVLLAILGAVRQRWLMVIAGVGVATLARQSALPAAFAFAVWLLFLPRWRERPAKPRVAGAGAVVIIAAVVYLVVAAVAAPFSVNTTPNFSHFTLLADLEHLPSGAGGLAQHFLRTVNGLFSVGALLAVVLIAQRRSRQAGAARAQTWACVLVGVSIAGQPAVFSSEYAAHNETRLAVLALGAFVCALAFAIRTLERQGAVLTPRTCAGLIALLALGSLHHIYTIVGPSNATQTLVLQIAVALSLAGLMWRPLRRQAPPPTAQTAVADRPPLRSTPPASPID